MNGRLMRKMTRLENDSVNALRLLSVDMVQKANSGHPGMPMGAAPMAYVLWQEFMRHNPKSPKWFNRDRFVLSCGHGSALLYSLLHLTGYDLTIEDLKQFRQLHSRTPGHPEVRITPGVEATTGTLGQGFANGVGMAIAEAYLAATFNKTNFPIVDHYTLVIASDGDLMEGVSSEAASIAGHLKLGKLICLYDDNRVSIDGPTELAFTESVLKRFEAYDWQVLVVDDAHDIPAIRGALEEARAETAKPSLIAVHSMIGYGAPNKEGKAAAHGGALGEDEVARVRERLEWPYLPFEIPETVIQHFRLAVNKGQKLQNHWETLLEGYRQSYPAEAAEFDRIMSGALPNEWEAALPSFKPNASGEATRLANVPVINNLSALMPELIGGSGDLAPAVNTLIDGSPNFAADNRRGRNLRFGVREHAMGAIVNGLALHGGIRPYAATFMAFSDYMRPSIRLAALMHLPVIFILSHDSITIGEDGPTHQPIEQLMSLRLIPNLTVIRPCDQNEAVEAWRSALKNTHGPTVIALTRHAFPILDRKVYQPASGLHMGAYILSDSPTGSLDAIIIATGSEIHISLEAQKALADKGIGARVVSMPSNDLFEEQCQDYKNVVIPPDKTVRITVEAGRTRGWERYAGERGLMIGIDDFGLSAPFKDVYQFFGFTTDTLVSAVTSLMVSERIEKGMDS